MRIKEADDHSKRLRLLESLKNNSALDRMQQDWLNSQIWALRQGARGERNAAHYIDHHYKDSSNLAVIHDLRLEWGGEVVQIDHLIISRGLIFYLFETKNFSGNLRINEHGEFAVEYGSGERRTQRGIPSPLQQSKRHEKVLGKWLEHLGITGRFGSKPQFFHAVLVDPKGTIARPDARQFDTANVIKADQIDVWRGKHIDKTISVGQTLSAMVNLRGADTVREWAEKLARQHRALAPQQWLPDFMKPATAPVTLSAAVAAVPMAVAEPAPVYAASTAVVCANCAKPLSCPEQAFCVSKAAIFDGQMLCMAHQQAYRQSKQVVPPTPAPAKPVVPQTSAAESASSRQRKLICVTCGVKISFDEGKFCWNQAQRFGGGQYCRSHQAGFR